jgi:hypothetical protein
VQRAILAIVALAALASSSLGATPAKSKKKRHPTTTSSSTPVRKRAGVAKTPVKGSKTTVATGKRKGKATKAAVARSYQQAPSQDRYREIQQALTTKGYFHGEANGEWGPESIDALKRFQTDQNLMPDGKIGSLSLIALGLGPKRLTAKSDASTPAPPPAATAPPPTAPPPPPQ